MGRGYGSVRGVTAEGLLSAVMKASAGVSGGSCAALCLKRWTVYSKRVVHELYLCKILAVGIFYF